jgi:hypothetical protein
MSSSASGSAADPPEGGDERGLRRWLPWSSKSNAEKAEEGEEEEEPHQALVPVADERRPRRGGGGKEKEIAVVAPASLYSPDADGGRGVRRETVTTTVRTPQVIMVQANAEAQQPRGQQAATSPSRRPKTDTDLLGECMWEGCRKKLVKKDPLTLASGQVLACSPDCGHLVIHDDCAVKMVSHYGEDMPERANCDVCGNQLPLESYVRRWNSWEVTAGAAWDVASTLGRWFFRYVIVLAIFIAFAHRAAWFSCIYVGACQVDVASNPWLAPPARLTSLDLFAYRFVWRDLSAATVFGGDNSTITQYAERLECRLTGACSKEQTHVHYTKPDCVARWYPGFVLHPVRQLCELEHILGAWLLGAVFVATFAMLRYFGVLRLVSWVGTLMCCGWCCWGCFGLFTHAKRKRLNAQRFRRMQAAAGIRSGRKT